jgi:hypothetical protein
MRQVAVCVPFERSGENGNSHETVTNEAVTHLLHCGEREEPPPPRNPCQMGQKPSLIPYPKMRSQHTLAPGNLLKPQAQINPTSGNLPHVWACTPIKATWLCSRNDIYCCKAHTQQRSIPRATSHTGTLPEVVAVEVGDAVGVALPELLPVNVGEGLLDIVPVTEGVLEGLTVTESERGKPGTMHLHCCVFLGWIAQTRCALASHC